jgi:GT2 family glycosyltransferase
MIVPEGIDWEVLLVDNNSKDETRKVAEEFSRKGTINLRYFFEGRQGKSFALNKGLENARGGIIAFLDDDVLMDKGWLTAVIKSIQKYQDYDGFGGRIISVWKTRLPEWLAMRGKYKSLRGTGYLRDDGCDDKEYSETENQMPCGANMFFRRRAIEENGVFRLDLGPKGKKLGAAEDTEYCWRMLQSGKKFMYIGDALIYHQVEPEKLTKRYLTKWRYCCARSVVRSKGIPDNTICYFDIPRYLIKQLFEALIRWNLSADSKRRFYHKLRFYWTLGEIVESYKMRRSSCNIRII